MSEMVERVARAIAYSETADVEMWSAFVEVARAAIDAMRGPPEVILRSVLPGLGPNDIPWMEAVGIWQAIIDEALK
jgi:hypothetical protein